MWRERMLVVVILLLWVNERKGKQAGRFEVETTAFEVFKSRHGSSVRRLFSCSCAEFQTQQLEDSFLCSYFDVVSLSGSSLGKAPGIVHQHLWLLLHMFPNFVSNSGALRHVAELHPRSKTTNRWDVGSTLLCNVPLRYFCISNLLPSFSYSSNHWGNRCVR